MRVLLRRFGQRYELETGVSCQDFKRQFTIGAMDPLLPLVSLNVATSRRTDMQAIRRENFRAIGTFIRLRHFLSCAHRSK